MERQCVLSSNIRSIGYEPSYMVLEIEFNKGGVYRYFDVPEEVYEELMAADSHGKYFDARIKKGGYRCAKIR